MKVFRWLGWIAAGSIILTGLVLAAFYWWLNSYLRGDDFLRLVSTETSKALRLQGEYLPFHWSGFSVHSDGFYGKGEIDGPVASVRADQLRADLNLRPILNGVWSVPRVDVQSLQLEFTPKTALTPAPPTPEFGTTSAEPSSPPAAKSSSGFLASLLPNRVDIGSIFIHHVNATFTPGPPITLRDLEVTLTPEGKTWNISGVNGRLRLEGWPSLTIQNAKLRSTPEQIFVTKIEAQLEGDGMVEVTGDIDNRDRAPLRLQTDIKRAPLTSFLTGDWRARLVGNLTGQINWNGELRGEQPVLATGTMQLLEGRIEALPILNQVALLTKTEEFRSLKLHKASAEFTWSPKTNRLEVRNIVLESERLVRVQGQFVVENDVIDGTFSIGTTSTVLKYVPGAESQVFTESRDGYLWAPLHLTGPVNSPKDDLTPKLQAAAINSLGEKADEGIQKVIDAAKSLLPF